MRTGRTVRAEIDVNGAIWVVSGVQSGGEELRRSSSVVAGMEVEAPMGDGESSADEEIQWPD